MEVYRGTTADEDAFSMLIPGLSNGGVRLGTRDCQLMRPELSPEALDALEEAKAQSVREEEARRDYLRALLLYRVRDVSARVSAARRRPRYQTSPFDALAKSGAIKSARRLEEYISSGVVEPEAKRMAHTMLAPALLEIRLATQE